MIFETPYCVACDEMHDDGFTRVDVERQLQRFDVVRFGLADRTAESSRRRAQHDRRATGRAR